ncbi:snurportin-1, partial [Haematococcus lacustris]
MDCSVATSDDPPVVLGQMPVAWVEAMGPKVLRPGRLLKFVVQEILFQYLARTKPTSIEELIAAGR